MSVKVRDDSLWTILLGTGIGLGFVALLLGAVIWVGMPPVSHVC